MDPKELRERFLSEVDASGLLGDDQQGELYASNWPNLPHHFPVLHAPPRATLSGTRYLRDAGVVMIARPCTFLDGVDGFLGDVEPDSDYLDDEDIASSAELIKFAGQLCYLSLGEKRTRNKDASGYLKNIKSSGHGSVLEHATYSVLLYGVSRALTHELVRHRAGTAFSQVSQRYVPVNKVRFVEAFENRSDPALHASFEAWIDRCLVEYETREKILLNDYTAINGAPGTQTALRKQVRQAARRCLPNETEAPMVMTANLRAWRHLIEMRCSEHADVEIRRMAYRLFLVLATADPLLWEDYEAVEMPDGKTWGVRSPFRKV